ncbi:MAG: M23 family metallopeptidase [Myxococcales bacterium]|nr:M23 family metallopeptidase [Myxococcales bacterium]MCB9750847.1 M23 family metallopeptidase [Myxococcales bacterium]
MFSWVDPGTKNEGYYDEEGRGVAKTFLKSPLKFTRISSGFNPKRMHPVLHRVKGHMGTDYAAPEGAPVWAAADGTITFRGKRGGAGNMVIMRHEGGLSTLYMHLSKFARGQRVGQRVKQKTVIGYVGSTGLATGPHLHFGVRKGGRYVDPQSVGNHRAGGVGKQHLARYKRTIAPLVRQLDALAVPAPEG